LAEGDTVVQALLLTFSARGHLMVLTVPSLLADRWSLSQIFREVAVAYLAHGQAVVVTDTPGLSYATYAEWQNQVTAGQDDELSDEFWRKLESEDGYALDLPFEKKVTPGEFRPEVVRLDLQSEEFRRIEQVASTNAVSLSQFLL